MARLSVPWGTEDAEFELPATVHAEVIGPQEVAGVADAAAALGQALDDLLGVSWQELAGAKSVGIAVNDKTRPVPHDLLLPPLLNRLEGLGLEPSQITLYVANGTHASMTPDEYGMILPQEIIDRYPIVSHDCDDEASVMLLGKTSRGKSRIR